jgi:hypothetical protein
VRERRSGVWEVRVVVANDPVTGRSVQRSFTVRGDREFAEARRRELVERFGLDRGALYCEAARWSVAELLNRWVEAEHQWRPATRSSHESVVRFLHQDRLGGRGLAVLAPRHVEDAFARWRAAGASAALVWGRWAVLHSALAWAASERLLRSNPLEVMRGPPRPAARLHLTPGEVAQLLRAADDEVERTVKALADAPANGQRLEGLFVAEQTRLLVRLAADSAAVNWRCFAGPIFREGCCRSSVVYRLMSWARPSRRAHEG